MRGALGSNPWGALQLRGQLWPGLLDEQTGRFYLDHRVLAKESGGDRTRGEFF